MVQVGQCAPARTEAIEGRRARRSQDVRQRGILLGRAQLRDRRPGLAFRSGFVVDHEYCQGSSASEISKDVAIKATSAILMVITSSFSTSPRERCRVRHGTPEVSLRQSAALSDRQRRTPWPCPPSAHLAYFEGDFGNLLYRDLTCADLAHSTEGNERGAYPLVKRQTAPFLGSELSVHGSVESQDIPEASTAGIEPATYRLGGGCSIP
jgi:hypothetical protein